MSDPVQILESLFEGFRWAGVVIALRALFLLFLARILWLLVRMRLRPDGKDDHPELRRPCRFLAVGLCSLFLAALIHQGYWQLFGHTQPKFVDFMQQYDKRGFNPAHRMSGGRLLDRNGSVMAFSRIEDGRLMRRYPMGPATSHIVGYQHRRFGKAGLEKAAQSELLGASLEIGDLLQNRRSSAGGDVRLTIDGFLQETAYFALRGKRGAAVVLDSRTGAILVLASAPTFDPNRLDAKLMSDPSAPLLNRALAGLYPPGSTFKVAIAALSLELGFNGKIDCPAEGFTTSANRRPIRDHAYYTYQERGQQWPGYGELSMTTALERSSNTFFAQLGVRYGATLYRGIESRFLFNEPISIHRGSDGELQVAPSRIDTDPVQDPYEFAQMGIGQGKLEVTPMEMALVAQSIANRGVMMKPFIALDATPVQLVRVTTESVASEVATMMQRVVTNGTGRGISMSNIAVAGKTGTAENPHGASHSWFIGFAPAEAPAIAFAVLIENGGFGSEAALPITKQLVERASALGHLQPQP